MNSAINDTGKITFELTVDELELLVDITDGFCITKNFSAIYNPPLTPEEYDALKQRMNSVLDEAIFGCADCSENTKRIHEYYMVQDVVWAAANMPLDHGMLCIGCLEARINRKLVSTDFINCPVNSYWPKSQRLHDRMGDDAS